MQSAATSAQNHASQTRAACLLDVRVDPVALAGVVRLLDEYVQSGVPHQIVTVNLDFIRIAQRDAEFRAVINAADLSVADGVPVVWAARLFGVPIPGRVTGVDIVERGVALAAERGYRLFLLGAAPGVAAAAASALQRRCPALLVAGTYSPPYGPFSAETDAHIVDRIRAARPDMLFVAFGAPRQDLWIARHKHELGVPVCVGVGGTFDLLAGNLARAPRWMQRAGLEWT